MFDRLDGRHDARRFTRVDSSGAFVTLEQQDRSR